MKNKTKKKNLRLETQTIRELDVAQLATVQGGVRMRDSDCDTCAERGC